MPTINFNANTTTIPQTGGTTSITVTYGGLDVNSSINTPFTTVKGVSIVEEQPYGKTVKTYIITVEATKEKRDIPFICSCFDSTGKSATEVFMFVQNGNTEVNEVISINNEIEVVPAARNSTSVTANLSYPNKDRTTQIVVTDPNGYPATWCDVELLQRAYTTDLDAIENYEIRIGLNSVAYPRVALVNFVCYDIFERENTVTLTIIQEAADTQEYTGTAPYIQPYVTTLNLDGNGDNLDVPKMNYFRVAYYNLPTISLPKAMPNWIIITGEEEQRLADGGRLFTYYFSAQPTTTDRTAQITVGGRDADGKINIHLITVKQYAVQSTPITGEDYTGPIWKDVEYGWDRAEVDYTIFSDNELLFKGRTYRRPNSYVNSILINRICQNYITTPDFSPEKNLGVYGGYKEFELRDGDGTDVYNSYAFVNDWSYSKDFGTGVLSHPILNQPYAIKGQYTPFSVFADSTELTVPYGINYADITRGMLGDWNSEDVVKNNIHHNWFIRTKLNPEIDSIYIGNRVYEFAEKCKARFVLYYVNPWGGFDWFPAEAKYEIKDNLRSYNYIQNYNNTTYEFGDCKYLSEIDRHYILTTRWLKQEESDRMWYLLESTKVYLHDLQEDKLMPVLITDNTVTHKRKDRGNKIIQYTFDVKLSQQMERA